MYLLGITFLLLMLNISGGKGFWYNLRLSNKKGLQRSDKVQRSIKKIKHCHCALIFCLAVGIMVLEQ